MNDPRLLPVVAIEAHGLLVVPSIHAVQLPPHYLGQLEIKVLRDRFPEQALAQPEWDADGRWVHTYWISRLGLAWVEELTERNVEVVWASAWLQYANEYFGRTLGLPYMRSALREESWAGATVGDAAVRQLGRQFDGRPLLMISDSLPLRGRRELEDRRLPADRALTRLQFIPRAPSAGDIFAMDEWIALAQTKAGHARLRRLRQADLERRRRRSSGF